MEKEYEACISRNSTTLQIHSHLIYDQLVWCIILYMPSNIGRVSVSIPTTSQPRPCPDGPLHTSFSVHTKIHRLEYSNLIYNYT